MSIPSSPGLNKEQWDRLLKWLDADTDKAAERYESIRMRLVRIFVTRGSATPEELADLTIDRVAIKLAEIQDTYVGEPAHYFYGVAKYVFRESLRKEKVPDLKPPAAVLPDEDEERDYACLEKCIQRLPSDDRSLVVDYYQYEKQTKIDHRKSLAQKMGLGLNAVRIRACRIRAALMKCVEDCRAETATEFAK